MPVEAPETRDGRATEQPGGDRAGGAVRLDAVVKRYGAVVAVNEVSLSLEPREIRALLGENGAGKSTLMGILYGTIRPDSGRIVIDGRDVTRHWSPAQAIQHRLGMIHQHFSLVDEYTVLENVVMPTLGWRDLLPDWRARERHLEQFCAQYGFSLALAAPVERLSVGERQQVEIVKALYQGARTLILDEPTGVLTPMQTETLLAMLVRLRAAGHTVVLITHKLREAMAVADRITVLRGGLHVATVDREAVDEDEIARLMLGQVRAAPTHRASEGARGPRALEMLGVAVDGPRVSVDEVTLSVEPGEIVGIAGVAGNGQSELAAVMVGYLRVSRGRILLNGRDVTMASVRHRQREGLSFIPEDRHALGLVLDMSVAANLVLNRIDDREFSRWGVLRRHAIDDHAHRQIREYEIRTTGASASVRTLSGGNQQKIVVSRALGTRPTVVVAFEPTRGLDFRATAYIRQRLIECARDGTGIVVISTDLEELMLLCDRIAIMYRGRVVGDLSRGGYSVEAFSRLMTGLTAAG